MLPSCRYDATCAPPTASPNLTPATVQVSGASSDRPPRSLHDTFTEEFSPTDDEDVWCTVDWTIKDLFLGVDASYIQLSGYEAARAVNWTQRISFEKWPLREAKPLKAPLPPSSPAPTTTYDSIVKIDTWSDTPLRSHSASWRKATRDRLLRGLNARARLELEGDDDAGGAGSKPAA